MATDWINSKIYLDLTNKKSDRDIDLNKTYNSKFPKIENDIYTEIEVTYK